MDRIRTGALPALPWAWVLAAVMTLTVFDDDKAVLTMDQELTPEQLAEIRDAYRRWVEQPEVKLLMFNGAVIRLHQKAPGELEVVTT